MIEENDLIIFRPHLIFVLFAKENLIIENNLILERLNIFQVSLDVN